MGDRFQVGNNRPKNHVVKSSNEHKAIGLCGAQGWWEPSTSEQKRAIQLESFADLTGAPDCSRCNQLALRR